MAMEIMRIVIGAMCGMAVLLIWGGIILNIWLIELEDRRRR